MLPRRADYLMIRSDLCFTAPVSVGTRGFQCQHARRLGFHVSFFVVCMIYCSKQHQLAENLGRLIAAPFFQATLRFCGGGTATHVRAQSRPPGKI